MELRTLQYFLAVTKEENITRAAESLHISQPYLSKQLMELENEFRKTIADSWQAQNYIDGRRNYP